MAWAGRVDDEPRALWVDYMRNNVNLDFVDNDPDEGPQPIVDDALEDWNPDENAGGLYELSDNEQVVDNVDYCIFKCDVNDSVRDLRRKKRKATYRALYKEQAISLGVWDGEYPSRLLDDFYLCEQIESLTFNGRENKCILFMCIYLMMLCCFEKKM